MDAQITIVSKCTHCDTPVARFINCSNDDCHKQYICCEKCEEEHHGLCDDCVEVLEQEGCMA
jgi:UPF0176 protein